MNRNYFGDLRDLFKFDLVRHIINEIPGLESFTFVPMLTESDEKTGQKKSVKKDLGTAVRTGKAGSKNKELISHMQKLQEIENDLDYFSRIRTYFGQENIMIDIIHRDRFSHRHREAYFQNVFENFPKKSLIFLDPDIGLEVRASTQRHLLYDEVKRIFEHMDQNSIMMIYQHIPRVVGKGYINKRCGELRDLTGSGPVTITDNEIVFFLLAKNSKLRKKLDEILENYTKSYPLLMAAGCR